MAAAPQLPPVPPIPTSFHGQGAFTDEAEDEFVFARLFSSPLLRNGNFIEIGAHDGIIFSNTLFFERNLSWSGLLVEPSVVFTIFILPKFIDKMMTPLDPAEAKRRRRLKRKRKEALASRFSFDGLSGRASRKYAA